MRLICPNCSAQYEIDETLIPDEGRDVQCSNCGHTWFELPPAMAGTEDTIEAMAEAQEDDQADDLPPEDDYEDENDTPSHAALAIAAASEDDDSDDEIYESSSDDDEDWDIPPRPASAPAPAPAQPRRPVDAASVDILKEEAEREMSQRRATPTSRIETQSELGLEDIRRRQTPSRALRARMAHLQEDEAESEDPKPQDRENLGPPSQAELVSNTDYQAPRRDLLPDIDEINSTLKSTKKRDAASEADQKSGFRAGFLLMTLAAVFLIVIYAQAPAIARALPGSETALISYVDGANSLRDWVDGLMGK